jgi:HEAT repeat protein
MGRTKITFLLIMAGLIISLGLVSCLVDISHAKEPDAKISEAADINAVIADLKSARAAVRIDAIRKLSRIKSGQAAEALTEHFAVEQDAYVKRQMIKVMSLNQSTGTVKAVLSALEDPNPQVRQTAATELGNFDVNNKEIVAALSNALKNESNKGVTIGIVNTLGSSKEPAAVDTIERTLKHKDKDVKRIAVKSLGGIGTKKAIGVLENNRNNPNDRELRDNIRQALKTSTEKAAREKKKIK